tara:strand:- start:23 stop:958 length:936 start_codon:yes stop_codon:yes gene_type:complete
MKILSLFDGMSCGRLALDRAGIVIDKYFASEIDRYAISIAKSNYPDTVHIGNVCDVYAYNLPPIDLLIGGSPCQGFSFAGKHLNFDDPRSQLFFEYVRVLKETKPKYFLMENVRMSKQSMDAITDLLGVEPVAINSNLVSAQNRYRLYWTNIPMDGLPVDKGIMLKDILENNYVTNRDKSHCIDANYFKGGNLKSYFEKHRRQLVFTKDGLCQVGETSEHQHYKHDQVKRVYHRKGKAPTLLTMQGGNREPKVFVEPSQWRKLTVLECERLQTVPDNYTKGVSNTQRYKMLGNGWTIDVVAHIMKGIRRVQ